MCKNFWRPQACVPNYVASTMHILAVLCVALNLLGSHAVAQDTPQKNASVDQAPDQTQPSRKSRLARLPIEWIIGPYIPVQASLQPLTNPERQQIYLRQTFLNVGSYLARGFSSGLDQARGEPHDWGAGAAGYGRRYAARYGEFVIQNSLVAGGNALLGYEPRYDFCRCDGFWHRTLHAVSRNFVAYDRTERNLRPQFPSLAGAYAAGMIYNAWLPENHSIWKGGAYSVLSQAAIGSGYNFVSEFSLDILHALGLKRNVRRSAD
jgi:hypothetical protein